MFSIDYDVPTPQHIKYESRRLADPTERKVADCICHVISATHRKRQQPRSEYGYTILLTPPKRLLNPTLLDSHRESKSPL